MIESYNIKVSSNKIARVIAKNVWGALRGLATFSQLIWASPDNKVRINHTEIEDSPRFSHRGILVDTARHYIPVAVLLRNLDAMEFNKFNVLHWHIIDDQSFPYQSNTFPELHNQAAYSSYHTYSSASVAEVIEHARLRGIRVIPEIGTPRHTYSIGRSHPELIIRCNGSKRADDILNPATNKTYAFLENLYTEISEVFRDKYIHIGMNDFDMSCWKTNEAVSNYMKKSGLVLMSQMARYYVTRIQKLIEKTAKNAIVWEDPLDIGVKMHRRTVIVQVYKNWKRDPIGTVVRQEYRVIDSTCWNTSSVPSPDAWKTDYLCDPHKFPGSILDYDLVVGGEMLHWGMQIGSSNFFGSLWPRAAAVAERLWSTKSTRDLDDAIFRLEEQRCRMIMLGIPSSPVIPGYCREEYDGYFRPSSSASKYTSSAAMMYIALACIFDLLSQFFTGHDYGEYPHSAEPS
ncbi:beta-hexosaminidase subunit beta-like [Tubulanus polymorphus]|uniref:beta-hexosaminidase subunit beta-like n=1 Tax=Tubulanus polymorphus TaxID=672921 RepID=UPI003DA4011B